MTLVAMLLQLEVLFGGGRGSRRSPWKLEKMKGKFKNDLIRLKFL